MSKYRQRIGAWGENAAAEWLARRGYEIVARNVRTPYGEIDLIARLGEATVFVEVKTLTGGGARLPEENVTPRKLRNMTNAAQHYSAEHEIDCWQLDVIAVEGKPNAAPPLITHFENVS